MVGGTCGRHSIDLGDGRLPFGGGADFVVVHLLAIVLLIAAFAKAAAETTVSFWPIPWELVTGIEAAAGILLVAFRRASAVRAAVGCLFLIFAGAAFSAAWRGLPSCNCLGELPLAPWKMLVLDLFGGTWLLVSAIVLWPSPAEEVDQAVPRARMAIGLAALAAVAVTAGAGGAAWVEHAKEAKRPLRVDSKQLVLGTMWLREEKLAHELTITNVSASELTALFSASCACTEIEPEALKLATGKSATVRLTIDPFKIARENWAATSWPIAIDVTAIGPAAKDLAGKWTIMGDMLSPFLGYPTADAESITLWRIDEPARTKFDVRLAPGVSARGISAVSPGTSCTIDLKDAARDDDDRSGRM